MKSPVLALHERAAPNKKHCNPIFIVCAPVLLILHCNLRWPRALWGVGGGGVQPALVRLELPVSRYSCPGRRGAHRGKMPTPDAHIDAHAH